MARGAQVLARLHWSLQRAGVDSAAFPDGVEDLLLGAQAYPRLLAARARWELRQLLAVARPLGIDLMLLKGGAYLEAGLPVAEGRIFSDLDLLVPEAQVDPLERALLDHGWQHQQLNAYDQRYYRQWMHEIPPLRHPRRYVEVDIHHRILPRTSRLTPDTAALLEQARPLAPGLSVLAPVDMLLHSATHLFYDGDLDGRFRELLDIHQLFQHIGADAAQLESLPERAHALDLVRPLFFAVQCCTSLLDTPLPTAIVERISRLHPSPRTSSALLPMMQRALLPREPGAALNRRDAWPLYARSHWLRMRPGLLSRHLARKALRRLVRRNSTATAGP